MQMKQKLIEEVLQAVQNNTSTASAAVAGAAAGSVLGSSTVQVDGLDDLFNNLNKTITNAQDSTNDILKNQLDEQKNMNSELKNQTNSINNVGVKIDKLKDDIGYNLNDIKKHLMILTMILTNKKECDT